MQTYPLSGGSPDRLGAHHDGNGVNFAVFSEHADKIELCLFSADGSREEQRIALPERTGPIWHGYLDGLPVGTLYGYRAHGTYAPEQGHRFNPNKLLLDPYTREMRGQWVNHPALCGYDVDAPEEDLSFDPRDSAPFVPKSVVSDPALFQGLAGRHRTGGARDLIYEAHPKGLTQEHPGVPEALRGTYEGLASDAVIDHLKALGVQAIELLPVHGFIDDKFLLERGLRNYWGYNSIAFFAPEPRYFGPEGLHGFRAMVDRFHAAGIEVILDVVYNHTAEGDQRGPTLSFRGLDNASYYRLSAGRPRFYVNDTGCGNTVNVAHPYVLRMVLDSLRFWVECMGVDGFRFDLATTLGREDHGFAPNGGFFDALRQDPVLAGVRLIAEPWDIGPGGYRLGEFPHVFSEWNDSYRDTLRRYWRGDAHSAQELGARLLGSADMFDRGGRRAWSSINFIASHDGFTLADVTRYNQRHNHANTEKNRDGHHSNFSDNCGVEGDTDDPAFRATRARRQRNMLATLFLSQGTPMLLAGDEIGNSQGGNNNAYCQDNEIGWINWDKADEALLSFVQRLSEFRQVHPSLRQSRFLHGGKRAADGLRDVEWRDFQGEPLEWRDPGLADLCVTLRGSSSAPEYEPQDDAVFLVFNRSPGEEKVVLPEPPVGQHWIRKIDTDRPDQDSQAETGTVTVAGQSVVAFALGRGTET
ncbi:glycogen debranching protein GlgX [Primorskyibacter aestuariivivens]|uniref:glycogen debranching protein GlgX n=1 Tax=Primorskyibacter aestuariivivens TaxID=1888912 RepID=UPI0023011207|nr:glycogen debranching protein GlgX [Primorskyibacter aestuariivivens]MDA7427576.1 glycogen debranching protein GlgX [Primorskyibacter aestuariivivens]